MNLRSWRLAGIGSVAACEGRSTDTEDDPSPSSGGGAPLAGGGTDADVTNASIRLAVPADLSELVLLCVSLWPDEPADEVSVHVSAILEGEPLSTLPLTLFVAERKGTLIGFIEVGLRSHAEGCDLRRAVGFIEGWYVRPEFRRQGVGRSLTVRAETWSREQGAVEIASDTWIDHQLSIDAHQALGFEIAERTIHFRKSLL